MYKNADGKLSFKKPAATAAETQAADANIDMGYRQRAKQEQKRMEDNVRDDFWLCVCFKQEPEMEDFRRVLGLPKQKHYRAAEFSRATERFKPDKARRTFPRKPKSSAAADNPREGLEFRMGDLQAAFVREADAIYEALKAARRPEPCAEVTDSDIWFTVVFENGQAREEYLREWNLNKYGDRYLDGTSWLKDISG